MWLVPWAHHSLAPSQEEDVCDSERVHWAIELVDLSVFSSLDVDRELRSSLRLSSNDDSNWDETDVNSASDAFEKALDARVDLDLMSTWTMPRTTTMTRSTVFFSTHQLPVMVH